MPRSSIGAGSVAGVLVFLAGIGLLVLTFQLAYRMFEVPPSQALGQTQGAPLDLNEALRTGVHLIGRILLLLVMCIVGSVIANRGIRMYAAHRIHRPEPEVKDRDGAQSEG
jgi:hypothetical protein